MKSLQSYMTPELVLLTVDTDVISTSYADALPFLPTTTDADETSEYEI